MKRNMLLVPFLAVLTLMVVGFASANLATGVNVELNGEQIGFSNELVSFSGNVVPIEVVFTAGETSDDVKIKVSIYDGRDDVSVSSGRFNVVAGKVYKKLLALELPSDIDDSLEELTLSVEIYDADHATVDYDEDYKVSMQRESYTLNVLSVDYSSQVSAGDIVPVSVVIKNVGFSRMDDNYIVVSIPALGISTRGYAGDLIPNEDYIGYDNEEDSVYKTVYLKIPSDAQTGVYEVKIAVYNEDTETVVTKLISVEGEEEDDSDVTPLEGDDDSEVSPSVVALTVVLVIIFVVLLAVLIVLLTKKEKPIEEVETSYY